MRGTKFGIEEIGQFLSKLAEQSQNVYWLSSPDFKRIVYISAAYEEIWGRSREALYNNPETWIESIYSEDIKDYHPIHAMAERLKNLGAEARYDEYYRIIRPDGSIRSISDHGFPIYIDGKCYGVTGVAVDVTKEKLLEQERIRAKQKEELAEKTRIDFIHNVEHDIRTPLSGLYGMSNALAFQETDLQKKDSLQDMAKCAKELLDYCNIILDFSKAEVTSSPLIEKKFNLHELINKIFLIETPAARMKGLKFIIEYDKHLPDNLIGDQNRLYRVLINLAGNAIKFTEKGYVKVGVYLVRTTENGYSIIKIVVEDTGIGIPEDKKDIIYEKFSRLVPSNKGLYKGTGLGLRIVKQHIEEMEGEIEVESQLNKGTKFICTLPVKVPLA